MSKPAPYPINDTDDRTEQNQIEHAIWSAIPVGTYWHNILVALMNVMRETVYQMTKHKLQYYKKREYVKKEKDDDD